MRAIHAMNRILNLWRCESCDLQTTSLADVIRHVVENQYPA